MDKWKQIKGIVKEVIDLSEPERTLKINVLCENDNFMIDQVKELIDLLSDEEKSEDFVDKADSFLMRTIGRQTTQFISDEYINTVIGPYQVNELLGEGGMGVVFLAEQQEPVVRHVALKIIKSSEYTDEFMSLVKSEMQAMAMMNHSYIAKIFDANKTESGLPYIVMEYIEGLPITEFCDHNKISLKERLLLFQKVCEGIQHAHQKGIIHRDIKPTNILVHMEDGKAIPKIIDFGVSKAIEKGHFWDFPIENSGKVAGTPLYMSPDQICQNQDIDVRSDIYSLGILLYELLIGVLPIQKENVSLYKLLYSVMFVDTPQLLEKLEILEKNTITQVLENRNVSMPQLKDFILGDVNAIVMKSLAKSKENRYSNVFDFMFDIQNYLDKKPVAARNGGSFYVIGKFIKRHKLIVAAIVISLAALIGGTIFAATGYYQATLAREKATIEAEKFQNVNQFLKQMLASANPEEDGRQVKVFDVLKEAETSLKEDPPESIDVELSITNTIATTYMSLGLDDESEQLIQRVIEKCGPVMDAEDPKIYDSRVLLTEAYINKELLDKAENEVLSLLEDQKLMKDLDFDTRSQTKDLLAYVYYLQGKSKESMAIVKEVYEDSITINGSDSPQTLELMMHYAMTLEESGDYKSALPLLKNYLTFCQITYGASHVETLNTINSIATLYYNLEEYDTSIKLLVDSLAVSEKILGEEDPRVLLIMHNLSFFYNGVEHYEKAYTISHRGWMIKKRIWGLDSMKTLSTEIEMISNLIKLKRFDEAEEICDTRFITPEPDCFDKWRMLSSAYSLMNKKDKCVKSFKKGIDFKPDDFALWLSQAHLEWVNNNQKDAEKLFNKVLLLDIHPHSLENTIFEYKDALPQTWLDKLDNKLNKMEQPDSD